MLSLLWRLQYKVGVPWWCLQKDNTKLCGNMMIALCVCVCVCMCVRACVLQVEGKMKYAKWKAVEITKCLKNGIPPTPGPPEGMGGEVDPGPTPYPPSQPGDASTSYYSPGPGDKPVPKPRHNTQYPDPNPNPYSMPPQDTPSMPPQDPPSYGFHLQPEPEPVMGATGGAMAAVGGSDVGVAAGASVGPEETAKAQKLCKFASSALDYEDVTGAVQYLQEALAILTTGKH